MPARHWPKGIPSEPIRLIVAFPPGGSTDMAARVLSEKLGESLGQPVIVENKPGASGNIGADAVARAQPDGYTLLMAATSFATSPAFFPTLSWSPTKDFAPVSMVASVPIVVVVNAELPVKSIDELISYAKTESRQAQHGIARCGHAYPPVRRDVQAQGAGSSGRPCTTRVACPRCRTCSAASRR